MYVPIARSVIQGISCAFQNSKNFLFDAKFEAKRAYTRSTYIGAGFTWSDVADSLPVGQAGRTNLGIYPNSNSAEEQIHDPFSLVSQRFFEAPCRHNDFKL